MMKVVYKHNAPIKGDQICTITEYQVDDDNIINCAIAKINGRYPTIGRVINEKCKELSFMIEGSGMLVVEGKEVLLNAGDCVLIQPKERYFWSGKMTLLFSCTPAWSPEQHKNVD